MGNSPLHLALLQEFRDSRWVVPWVDRRPLIRARAIRESRETPEPERRGYVFASLMREIPPLLWRNELLLGSWAGIRADSGEIPADDLATAQAECERYGERSFATHADHGAVDFSLALRHGIGGLRDRARASESRQGDPSRAAFLRSVGLALEGFADFVLGYANAAAAAAATATAAATSASATALGGSVPRGTELLALAETCRAVAWGTPATFRQALQLVWLIRLALALEGRYAMAFGRLDQFLHPLYVRDLAEGRLTKDSAQALLNCFFAKLGEAELVLGQGDVVNITIGGLTPAGADGTNELSYMCLTACSEAAIPTANLSARFHPESPHELYRGSARVIRTGIGFPAAFSDAVIVPALTRIGVPLTDARGYCLVGCIETFLQGKQAPWADGRLNLPKCLELALTSGVDLLTGSARGANTPPASELGTYASLCEALWQQLGHAVDEYVRIYDDLNRCAPPGYAASPFMSALTCDCIERGLDINAGGATYPAFHGVAAMGLATVADSLAVLRRLVYEEQLVSLPDLVVALHENWEGHERLRATITQRVPRYGNDDDYVDDLAAMVASRLCRLVLAQRTVNGGRYVPLIAANVSNVYAGLETGASPDGRFARRPLSDAASPAHGRDRLGITAAMRSLCKVDYSEVVGGSVVNQKLSPSVAQGEEGLERLAALLQAYFDLGGQEIQFNVVTAETLADALSHPDEHADLLVRVSGFSAYFTRLEPSVQQDIMLRTTQGL